MELERTAYEAALRSLDRQEQPLGEVRSRTGILVAAASLAASFLGRPTAEELSIPLFVAALLAFAVSIGASLYVLLPRTDLFFTLKGGAVYEGFFTWKDDPSEVYRRLAYALDDAWERNDFRLTRVFRAFRVAVAALAAEVTLLLAAVGGTLV